MNVLIKPLLPVSLFSALSFPVSGSEKTDINKLFKTKCALCHALDKKTLGPAIKAMSNDKEALHQVIAKGRKTMPAYEKKLTAADIDALVDYLLARQ